MGAAIASSTDNVRAGVVMGVALKGGREGGDCTDKIKTTSPLPFHSPPCPSQHIEKTIKKREQARHRWEGYGTGEDGGGGGGGCATPFAVIRGI